MRNGVPQKFSTLDSGETFAHIFLWYCDMLFNKKDKVMRFFSVDIFIGRFDSLLKCGDDINGRIIL